MNKRTILIAAAVVATLCCTAWAYRALRHRPDPKVAELQKRMGSMSPEQFRNMTPAEMMQRRDEFRKAREQLTPQQQQELDALGRQRREQGRKAMVERERSDLAAYFTMSPEQKQACLTKKINEEEQRRQQWESVRQQNGDPGPGGGPGGGPPDQQAAGNPGNGGNGPRGFNRDPYQRQQARIQMLNQTTPVQRAQRAVYYSDLNQQRGQMGLPPVRRPRFF